MAEYPSIIAVKLL